MKPSKLKRNYFFIYRHIHSSLIVEHNHNKYTRPSDVRWITIEDLEPERQYQFWVTAVTSAGEGMASMIITESPSARYYKIIVLITINNSVRHFYKIIPFFSRLSAKITSLSDVLYVPAQTDLNLQCSYIGDPIPKAKWFFNNHETGWLQQRTAYGQTNAYLENVKRDKHNGNYTCYAENTLGTDSIAYQVYIQGM